jgi:hypothetical protein
MSAFRMHIIILVFQVISAATVTYAQELNSFPEYRALDSMARIPGQPAYFSEIYLATVQSVEKKLKVANPQEHAFIRKYELGFMQFFIDDCFHFSRKEPVSSVWTNYFSDLKGTPLRLQLKGVNAHVNGDVWKALTQSFSFRELKENRHNFLMYQAALNNAVDQFYFKYLKKNNKLRVFHIASLGLLRNMGHLLLKRWRARQVKIALLYYNNPSRFKKKRADLDKKRERINRFIDRFF